MGSGSITLERWPRAILHLDADAFFASCEQAVQPSLKGKPVVTGKERGIVSAASYEAKRRGVKRAMRLFEAKKACPETVFLPSDYEMYSIFSVRMFEIIRRFSPTVEEYSIDEAFVDLSGLRRVHHASYEKIAEKMRDTVERELDIPVSVGVSLTKVLAKLASKHKKPHGLVAVTGRDIPLFLQKFPIEKVWGIGKNTAALLRKFGVDTALDFARKDERFVAKRLSKPYREIWNELNGRTAYPVSTESKSSYKSISKTKTFTPPSSDKAYVFSQLFKNLENACIKARRHNLAAKKLILLTRSHDFRDQGLECRLDRPSSYPMEISEIVKEGFNALYREDILYRLTGVVLADLMPVRNVQFSLFDDAVKIEKMSRIYDVMDLLAGKFGKHAVHHAASLQANLRAQHEGERGNVSLRKTELLKGENSRQRLGLPFLQIKI
ncbi:MAG: DNA polymerase IV, partial [Candidatus Desulfatibia sp.]|uniref:DNA polymerase Y family protein n=1 Tax=Candidatus Desulfatibia sp. TaxID=3101189 RepID=UPI002F3134BA